MPPELATAPRARPAARRPETVERFACFGGTCQVIVLGDGPAGTAVEAARTARARLLRWHEAFTRFDARSELSRLNADPAVTVPVSPLLARLVEAAVAAAGRTGGLVDPTLVDEIERTGYASSRGAPGMSLRVALALAPRRAPAAPDPRRRWARVEVDRARRTVTRPRGVRLDLGGVAKGALADALVPLLAFHDRFVVDCGGDLRVGGRTGVARPVPVADPFGGPPVAELALRRGAVATSGISRRVWPDAQGRPAHHLLDPATGRPAFTGLVQVTALAPTAAAAEALSKAALLAGPAELAARLPHGGVAVTDEREVLRFEAAA
jgi:thiamine biosynthesis lipoprotein